jgi:serine acetyltransferase
MHIGDHATIGAGSTVVENIAAGAMVAGTPAKPMKRDL